MAICGLVAIPYSSGHSFQLDTTRDFHVDPAFSRNPLFIRSFLPTRRRRTPRCARSRTVAIPYSSGHSFQQEIKFESLEELVDCRNPLFIRSILPTIVTRRVRRRKLKSRNPLFIRSILPTIASDGIHASAYYVAIPYSSGHSFQL